MLNAEVLFRSDATHAQKCTRTTTTTTTSNHKHGFMFVRSGFFQFKRNVNAASLPRLLPEDLKDLQADQKPVLIREINKPAL